LKERAAWASPAHASPSFKQPEILLTRIKKQPATN